MRTDLEPAVIDSKGFDPALAMAIFWDCCTNPRLILIALAAFTFGLIAVASWVSSHPPHVPTVAERIMSRLGPGYAPAQPGLYDARDTIVCIDYSRGMPADCPPGTR